MSFEEFRQAQQLQADYQALQNRTIAAAFKPFVLSCLGVMLVLQGSLWVWPQLYDLLRDSPPARTRALYYFGIVYTTVLPYYCLGFVRKLPVNWKPGVSMFRRVVATVFGWILFPACILLPFWVLLDPDPSGQKMLAIRSVFSHPVGLVLVGSMYSYGASVVLWMLVRGFLPLPRRWFDGA